MPTRRSLSAARFARAVSDQSLRPAAVWKSGSAPSSDSTTASRPRRHETEAWVTSVFTPHADDLAIPVADFVTYIGILAAGNALRFGAPRADASDLASFALSGVLRKELP